MSLFFQYKTDLKVNNLPQAEGTETLPEITATSWSHAGHPVLAVATSDGVIQFYGEEGETITREYRIERPGHYCTQLAWHHNSLATGWEDGCVLAVNEKDAQPRVDDKVHAGFPITVLVWAPNGSRFISGDSNGTVSIWEGDSKRKLQLLRSMRKRGPITHLCFRVDPAVAASSAYGRRCPPFFFRRHRVVFWG